MQPKPKSNHTHDAEIIAAVRDIVGKTSPGDIIKMDSVCRRVGNHLGLSVHPIDIDHAFRAIASEDGTVFQIPGSANRQRCEPRTIRVEAAELSDDFATDRIAITGDVVADMRFDSKGWGQRMGECTLLAKLRNHAGEEVKLNATAFDILTGIVAGIVGGRIDATFGGGAEVGGNRAEEIFTKKD